MSVNAPSAVTKFIDPEITTILSAGRSVLEKEDHNRIVELVLEKITQGKSPEIQSQYSKVLKSPAIVTSEDPELKEAHKFIYDLVPRVLFVMNFNKSRKHL